MSGQLNAPASALQSFGAKATQVGATLTATVTAAMVGVAAAGVKMAMDLDESMRNVQSITKQTDEEIARLSKQIVHMSTVSEVTVDSADNLAKALYSIVGSGIDSSDAMFVLEVATKAATAGLTTTEVAAEGMIAVLNSYGQGAEHAREVSDLMFQTVNRGVGTFEQLSSSMSNVVGMANAASVPFETVSAAMATMSKQGMTFAEASVSLNAALSDLIKPTTDGQAMIEAMGYASGEAMLNTLGLAGTLQAVEEHTGGSVTEMSKLFSSIRGLRGALALTGDGATMFAEDMAAMANATGAVDAAFAEQAKSFAFQWQAFRRDIEALAMDIGSKLLPILARLLEIGGDFITWFRGLPEPVRTAVYVIGGLLAVLGPLLLIVGQLIALWGSLSAAWAAVSAAAVGFGPAIAGAVAGLGSMLVAIAPLILAIGALGIALGALWALLQDERVKAIPKVWSANFKMLGEILGLLGEKAKTAGANFIKGFLQGMKDMAIQALKWVLDFSVKIGNTVKNVLKIKSPSKLMQEYGQMTVLGFQEGLASMGGIGVQVPALAGAGASVRPSTGGGMSGGGNVYIENINVPPGTSKEQIDHIMKEIGRQVKRRGGRG